KEMATQLQAAGSRDLARAREAVERHDAGGQAPQHMKRYLEKVQKAISDLGNLKKRQNSAEVMSASLRLEDLASRLQQGLQTAVTDKELLDLLSDIDREMQTLSELVSKTPHESLPEGFVNRIDPEDMPMAQAASARQRLMDALQRGDSAAAKEAAQEMLSAARRMRQALETASAQYHESAGSLLGSDQQSGDAGILGRLEDIAAKQQQMLAHANQIDQDVRKRAFEQQQSSPTLTSEQARSLQQQAQQQRSLTTQTKELLGNLVTLDREHPGLMIAAPMAALQEAAGQQQQAAGSLQNGELPSALNQQSAASESLSQAAAALRETAQRFSGQGGSGQQSGVRAMMSVPSGNGHESGSQTGLQTGPVKIPAPEDYHVPKESRQEILKALQENRPAGADEETGRYLKNLLK
ncbi:MAG: DUF4175 family protein, partial [Elusimicrobiota bacterium]